MTVEFVAIDRDTPYLLPASIQDSLPHDHFARLVVGTVFAIIRQAQGFRQFLLRGRDGECVRGVELGVH